MLAESLPSQHPPWFRVGVPTLCGFYSCTSPPGQLPAFTSGCSVLCLSEEEKARPSAVEMAIGLSLEWGLISLAKMKRRKHD